MRYVFSYGSKWMSEAPFLIASSSTLLTKRTIGASSTSSRPTASFSSSSSPPVTSRFSRSRSSSASAGICVSTCSIALLANFCSLSSSTTTASTDRPVWNLISSSACRLVGIGDGDEQPLAALDQRQHAVLRQQLVGDELDGFEVGLDRVQVEQRHAEFLRGGDRDLARVRDAVGHQVRHQVGVRFLGRHHRLRHGLLVDKTVLDQALGQSLQHMRWVLRAETFSAMKLRRFEVGEGAYSYRKCHAASNCQIAWILRDNA